MTLHHSIHGLRAALIIYATSLITIAFLSITLGESLQALSAFLHWRILKVAIAAWILVQIIHLTLLLTIDVFEERRRVRFAHMPPHLRPRAWRPKRSLIESGHTLQSRLATAYALGLCRLCAPALLVGTALTAVLWRTEKLGATGLWFYPFGYLVTVTARLAVYSVYFLVLCRVGHETKLARIARKECEAYGWLKWLLDIRLEDWEPDHPHRVQLGRHLEETQEELENVKEDLAQLVAEARVARPQLDQMHATLAGLRWRVEELELLGREMPDDEERRMIERMHELDEELWMVGVGA
jgi:hypothetical protein